MAQMSRGEMQIDPDNTSAVVKVLFMEEGRVVAKLFAVGGRQQYF